MQIRFNCPTDNCPALIELEPLEGAGETIECPRCRTRHAVSLTDSIRTEQTLDRCPLCRCEEFFIRKDFPQKLGLAIVVVAAATSVLSLKSNFALAWGVLLAAALVDLALYLIVGRVTVCYSCRAEYRKSKLNPRHIGFDLAQSEKY